MAGMEPAKVTSVTLMLTSTETGRIIAPRMVAGKRLSLALWQ
jgi:hypothetical protein